MKARTSGFRPRCSTMSIWVLIARTVRAGDWARAALEASTLQP
jgi:hypothetical protein